MTFPLTAPLVALSWTPESSESADLSVTVTRSSPPVDQGYQVRQLLRVAAHEQIDPANVALFVRGSRQPHRRIHDDTARTDELDERSELRRVHWCHIDHHIDGLRDGGRDVGSGVIDDLVRAVGLDPIALRALAVAITYAARILTPVFVDSRLLRPWHPRDH